MKKIVLRGFGILLLIMVLILSIFNSYWMRTSLCGETNMVHDICWGNNCDSKKEYLDYNIVGLRNWKVSI